MARLLRHDRGHQLIDAADRPSNILANNFGFKPAEYFKVAPEDQALPKVDLSLGTPTPRP